MSLPKSSAIFFLSGIKKGGHIPARWVSLKNYTWLCLKSASALDARKCHSSTRWLGLLRGRSSSGAEMRERWHTSREGFSLARRTSGRRLGSCLSLWLRHVGDWSGCWNTWLHWMMDSRLTAKLSKTYYSPRGYWKGLTAIKRLAAATKVSEDVAKDWLKKQAIWQIYLPAPRRIPRPRFDVSTPNKVHQADLLFLSHDRLPGVKRCTNMLSQSLTSPAATRRLSLLQARPQQRSPMPCLASTNGGLWSGPNCCRPTLGENSWARQASFWQNTGFLLGVVVWIFTGTKPL